VFYLLLKKLMMRFGVRMLLGATIRSEGGGSAKDRI